MPDGQQAGRVNGAGSSGTRRAGRGPGLGIPLPRQVAAGGQRGIGADVVSDVSRAWPHAVTWADELT
jgi:hypothetical protein